MKKPANKKQANNCEAQVKKKWNPKYPKLNSKLSDNKLHSLKHKRTKLKHKTRLKKKTPKESARNTKFCTINMSIYVTGLQPKSSTIFHQKMYKYT